MFARSDEVLAADRRRERSRSPRNGEDVSEEAAVTTQTGEMSSVALLAGVGVSGPAPVMPSLSAPAFKAVPLPSVPAAGRKAAPTVRPHSDVDFSTWTLISGGKNKYGNTNWNIRAPEYDGNVVNFHEFPSPSEGKEGDAWSTIVWDVKAETFEGAPSDKVKITFELSDAQEASMGRFDAALIGMIEKQSMEVLNLKTPAKRELIESQHYKSLLQQRSETRGPKVRMTFVVRSTDPKRLGVMYYYKLLGDGETYEKKPIIARGWDEIEPLIAGHMLRNAKMRATVVRCWSINVMKKEAFPTMEIREMWVREPKGRGGGHYMGLSDEQVELMNSMQ